MALIPADLMPLVGPKPPVRIMEAGAVDAVSRPVNTSLAGGTIQLSGTFSGTLVFEATVNREDYQLIALAPSNGSAPATSTNVSGIWSVPLGYTSFRTRVSAYTSGQFNVDYQEACEGGVDRVGGASGGASSAVTIADGDDEALGSKSNPAASSDTGTFSLIALFKRLLVKFTTQFPAALTGSGNFKVSVEESSIGDPTDAEATGDGSVIAILKRIRTLLASTIVFTPPTPTTSTRTSVAGSASTVTILAANSSRLGATIYHQGAAARRLFLALGSGATDTDFTIEIMGGNYYEVPFNYRGIITGVWNSTTGSPAARVTELT